MIANTHPRTNGRITHELIASTRATIPLLDVAGAPVTAGATGGVKPVGAD
jgi:hypothetical protein